MTDDSRQDASTDEQPPTATPDKRDDTTESDAYRPPDSDVVAELAEDVVELDEIDPGANLLDLHELEEVFADRRIMGLSEATHGTREFFQLKHRFVRFLVEELGFRLFGIEADFSETLALDTYVVHGDGDPRDALEGMYFWTWQTKEVLAFVEWIRAFNSERPLDDRVRFYGFDMQYTRGAATAVVEYLEDVDPDALDDARKDLEILADHGLRPRKAEGRGDRLTAAGRVIPELRTTFENHRSGYVDQSSESACTLARQHVTILEQAAEYTRAIHDADEPVTEEILWVRDRAMAENVAWILDNEPTDRIALWAHNAHINRDAVNSEEPTAMSMGGHLAERYDDDYYALGFEFGRGAFQALTDQAGNDEESPQYVLGEQTIAGPTSGTVAEIVSEFDQPLVFLTLDAAANEPALGTWLDREQRFRDIGAVYDPETPEEYYESYVLLEAFEGLCYVDETTRACPLTNEE